MATSGINTPFMGSVTVNAVTAQTLYNLLKAVRTSLQVRACYVQIQLATSAAGNSLYIGFSDVAANNNGATLSAGQIHQTLAFDSNLLDLNEIYLLASASELQVNLIVVTR